MNEYKSFYLRDVLGIIDRVAMETMLSPCMAGDPEQTPEERARQEQLRMRQQKTPRRMQAARTGTLSA